jgi:hypothetical protein
MTREFFVTTLAVVSVLATANIADAQRASACADLPDQATLKEKLTAARGAANGGFSLDMWATVVNRDGNRVCGGVHGRQPR